jgi:alkylhydroperoxidase family enzyme
LTENKIAQLDSETNDFTPAERLAVEYAGRMATDHHNIDDNFFARLNEHFSDAQIVELGMMIGQFIGFGRLLMVLDLEPRFCAVGGDDDSALVPMP